MNSVCSVREYLQGCLGVLARCFKLGCLTGRRVAALLLLLLLAGARADVTLISDPFSDGNRDNTTGGDPLGGVWWQCTANTGQVTIADDSAGIGTGNAMQMVPNGDFCKMI